MKTEKLLLAGVIAVTLLATVGTVFASDFGSFVNSGGVPAGSKLVLNINYKVVADEDSGLAGYWALDNYNKQVQVWQSSTDSSQFYVVARYTGNWNTFAGVPSPGNTGTASKDASGTDEGGYVATFTATSCTPTFGNIGTFNYGGTKADVLLGTYGAGQTGPSTPFDWTTLCSGFSNFNYINWGWTYHYHGQTWNNYQSATTGDIVV